MATKTDDRGAWFRATLVAETLVSVDDEAMLVDEKMLDSVAGPFRWMARYFLLGLALSLGKRLVYWR